MHGRRTTFLFPLALLGFLALLTLWIDRSVQEPEHKIDGSNRHDPDYIVNNFVTRKTDVDGNLRYTLAAVEMRHYPDDDSTKLVRPHFIQYAETKPYAGIEGQRGFVSSNGEIVQFMDNVKVVRSATKDRGEMVMLTEYLHITPDTEIATTNRPVVITQAPATVIHGTGMIFDKKQRTVKLMSKVRVHYEHPGLPKHSAVKAAAIKQPAMAQSALKQAKKSSVRSDKNTKRNTTSNTTTHRIRRKYDQPATP